MKFPIFLQLDGMDCGPTCLRMIAKYYGKNYTLETLRNITGINREGVNLLGISEAAEKIGFHTIGARVSFEDMKNEIPLPCIVYWNQEHFVVLYKIKKDKVIIGDPAKGIDNYSHSDFLKSWISHTENGVDQGIILAIEPTSEFYDIKDDAEEKLELKILLKHIKRYKKLIYQLLIGLLFGSLLQIVFPFLTQSIVDVGINTNNIHFIYIILIGQLALYLGKTAVDFIRGWILLHISTRISISVLTEFLMKLMQLPLRFFDTRMTGDILQRMTDYERIERFLTASTLSIFFSLFTFIIFTIVLAIYNTQILIAFLIGSLFHILWVITFLKKRKRLDFQRFELASKNQSKTIEIINGMQEIKLNNCENQKRWEWERIQAKLFKWNIKSLTLIQNQQAGAIFFNEGKNIFITFLSATAVISGHMTLGAMLAVQYIVGQLNSPIEQATYFLQSAQDAILGIERLNEIHKQKNEDFAIEESSGVLIMDSNNVTIKNLSFTYPGAGNEPVLNDINLEIPEGKITAIVGTSGSGKTTLLKLLLKFYDPDKGEILIGNEDLKRIGHKHWRSKCGVVMQDGFIFSNSIAYNIAVGVEDPDIKRLVEAAKVANIEDFIQGLPLGYNTKIGAEGNGISEGQKQRILIARAVYKNPDFIFFDEATNSLDANNERKIMHNLNTFFKGKTVIIVAHRLSTVKNADQIIVLEKSKLVEKGNHEELTITKGHYYNLVKNQLELGN